MEHALSAFKVGPNGKHATEEVRELGQSCFAKMMLVAKNRSPAKDVPGITNCS